MNSVPSPNHASEVLSQLAGGDTLLGWQRLELLANLPVLLNSSLELSRVIARTLDQLRLQLESEAATFFLLEEGGRDLKFWALGGEKQDGLRDQKMPADRGIVGWVIEHQQSVIVTDTKSDKRFFGEVDQRSGFVTRNIICVPLTARGVRKMGALQVLNRTGDRTFEQCDLRFLEQIASQVAMAIENSQLIASLSQRTVELEELNRRKSEMITVIVHEFRTPLHVIHSSADMIASGLIKDATALEKIGTTLKNGISRLTKLVSDVSTMEQVSREKLKINAQSIDLNQLLEGVTSNYAAVLQKRELTLTANRISLPLKLLADETLLRIALGDLIDNAIRFTPNGGKISVSATSGLGAVEIAVSDNGIGIAEEHQKLIFEKFYEVRDAMQHSSGEYEFKSAGIGLGLSTVRAIVEAHRGSITVESKLQQGSKFTMRFPIPSSEGCP